MIGLLDVNVLVALFDPLHTHHDGAHDWFGANRRAGWATCPMTENGLVRVISHPSYPGRRTTVADAITRLEALRKTGDHTFWPDSVSIRSAVHLRPRMLTGHRQITDAYLLALAVSYDGRFVTFDGRVPRTAVPNADPERLIVISG